jgi:hypothetical protein
VCQAARTRRSRIAHSSVGTLINASDRYEREDANGRGPRTARRRCRYCYPSATRTREPRRTSSGPSYLRLLGMSTSHNKAPSIPRYDRRLPRPWVVFPRLAYIRIFTSRTGHIIGTPRTPSPAIPFARGAHLHGRSFASNTLDLLAGSGCLRPDAWVYLSGGT